MRLKPVREQVVVVMGASSGIGRETALRFARKGARVVASARTAHGLHSVEEEIRSRGGECAVVVADVANISQVRAVAARAEEQYGGIDTWVHAAGVQLYAPFEQTTPEEWFRVIDVNLNGQAYGALVALPYLRRRGGGALIHITSIESRRPLPYQAAYSAAKHGVKALVETLRLELKHEGVPISVTEIIPGSIDTPLFNKARTKLGVKPKGLAPIYPPESVADAILYAASHPCRDLVVGGAAKMIAMGESLSPRIMDNLLERYAFEGQRTRQPKSEEGPDALFVPMDDDRIHGDLSARTRSGSMYTWMETHPWAVPALGLTALGAFAMMAAGEKEAPERVRPRESRRRPARRLTER
ncbi:MAG: SDR family oxidoreductase [Bryobacteraceae bacterium]